MWPWKRKETSSPAPLAPKPPQPTPFWRIQKDPHAAKFYVERKTFKSLDGGWRSYYIYEPLHTAATEAAARNWLKREIKRPIITASFNADGTDFSNTTRDEG